MDTKDMAYFVIFNYIGKTLLYYIIKKLMRGFYNTVIRNVIWHVQLSSDRVKHISKNPFKMVFLSDSKFHDLIHSNRPRKSGICRQWSSWQLIVFGVRLATVWLVEGKIDLNAAIL